MPYRFVIEAFGSTEPRIAEEGPLFTGSEPTLISPQNFVSSLEAAASFSVENLSELNGVWVWFAPELLRPTLGNPATPPTNALYFPPGTVRDFFYQGDHYSGYLYGLWQTDGQGWAGSAAAIRLNIIKTVHFCKP